MPPPGRASGLVLVRHLRGAVLRRGALRLGPPLGTLVHTEKDSPSRLVIRLPKPVQLRQIRLRTSRDATARAQPG